MGWGIPQLNGWAIADVPVHILAQAHGQLQKRYAKRVNDYNHSAALGVAVSQTEAGKQIHYEKWLPYKLGDSELEFIDAKFARELLALVDELPVALVSDLENSQILPHCREVGL